MRKISKGREPIRRRKIKIRALKEGDKEGRGEYGSGKRRLL
jgi:hypothetical protein